MITFSKRLAVFPLLAIFALVLAACGGGGAGEAEPAVETIAPEAEVTEAPEAADAPTETGEEAADGGEATEEPTEGDTTADEGAYTTPHPILGTLEVRQAIAYCTDRLELIQSVYPFIDESEQQALLMDSNVPQGHWALAEDITTYPFDPDQGNTLLEEAGWTLPEGQELGQGAIRENESGEQLSISFTTTDAQFRQTWATVLEQQLSQNCGIQIIREHAPASWWFGADTGLQHRDFELGAYAWVGEPDPKGQTLYACNQIPLPSNNWEGQNYMGWCNETASRAILAANNKLDREERAAEYAVFQQEFTADMISLPVFQRLEAQGISNNLENFRADPTEYATANIAEWTLADGGDTVVLGFSQEPATMFVRAESAAVATMASDLMSFRAFTKYGYDYQPVALTELPTIENGGATLETIEVSEGDMVWSATGEAVELTTGVEVLNAAGEFVEFAGEPIELNKLSVTFEYVEGLTWEDGEPVKQADFELAQQINCDPASGATSFLVCDSRESVDFLSDTSYTVNYLPGALWPEYFIYTLGASEFGSQDVYPSHQVLADGRNLADVPASEWATLPEIAETPLSSGPYRFVEWQKGQRMIFEANPNYYAGAPGIANVTIEIIPDTNQAVAQLLTGNVDVVDKTSLGAGPELETVLQAAEEGQIQAFLDASPTWEHIDMNLFVE